VLYGDFNCPWSYLASRRAALLAADGVEIDWRAVDHEAPRYRPTPQPYQHSPRRAPAAQGPSQAADFEEGPERSSTLPVRLGLLLEEMQQVLTLLLPSEELPYALAGFAPHTSAAVAAYAEAYQAGVAGRVRQVLFEAYWLHAFDLGDPAVVHTLIIDTVRSDTAGTRGSPTTAALTDWEYGTGVTHEAGATTQRLLDRWGTECGEDGNRTIPTLVVDGELLRGVDAVPWLGAEAVRRGLLPGVRPQPARAQTT
jgi:2-hydroxychromene-2-carboxylate isomerase